MATINYYLKGAISDNNILLLQKTDKEGLRRYYNTPLQIILKVSMAGSRLQIYTKKRIEPKFWQKNKQEVNCRKLKSGCLEINTWLSELKKEINLKCIQLETSSKRITKPDLQKILNQFSVRKSTKTIFSELMELFLDEHQTRSGNPLKLGSKKKYRVLVHNLNSFCEYKNISPNVDNISTQFFKDFVKYLRSELQHIDNTIVKAIKGCKTFFGFLAKKDLITPIDFSWFKTTEKEGEIYTLSIDEVLMIQNKDFKSQKLNDTRDVFCFQCWTGQRISDIIKIRWDEIRINEKKERVWNIISTKGEIRVSIPIIEYADKIISKYESDPKPLPLRNSSKINENLKMIGLRVGLTRKVRKTKYINGELNIEYIPFYKVLSTHVARKSFITNSLILDIPERIVRSISKHKDEKSFRRYVKYSEEFKNNKIREAFNFNTKSLDSS